MLNRRLKKELINTNYTIENSSNSSKIIKFNYNNYNIVIKISLDYPFKPPLELYINNRLMSHKYFNDLPYKIKSRLYGKSINKCCLLCSSCLCSDNWAPSLKLIDVVKEFICIINMINMAYNKEYIKKYSKLPLFSELLEEILSYF